MSLAGLGDDSVAGDRLILDPNKFSVADVHCLAECEIGKAGVAEEAKQKKKRIEVHEIDHGNILRKFNFITPNLQPIYEQLYSVKVIIIAYNISPFSMLVSF